MFCCVDDPVALAHLGVKEEACAAVVVRHLQGLQWEVRRQSIGGCVMLTIRAGSRREDGHAHAIGGYAMLTIRVGSR